MRSDCATHDFVPIAALVWLAVVAASCVACGGRSVTDPSEPGESQAPRGSDASTSTTGRDLDGELDLGECTKGWAPFEGECPWLGSDDLCYATKADACACLCPRDKRSTCVSGLPGGPDAQTAVSCF